jgi:hypothetical protein
MKKNILFLLLITLTVSCKSPGSGTSDLQNKAEETVKKYLADKLDDPKSYESVSFQPIDSIKEYQHSGEYVNFIKHGVLPLDTTNKVGFFGYTLPHEYRTNNKFGAKVKKRSIFYLSTDLNRIITEY